MGLFDHLFKSKSPPSEENSAEPGVPPAEPDKHSDDAARGTTSQRADPSAFLHPKSYVPRGITPLTPPLKSGAVSGVRKPGAAPAPSAPEEIVLTLGDVLSRIPTPYLKPGQHDPKRELRFSINDLSSDIARGRAAVPLSRIAQLVPDIFTKSISKDEDTEIRLPLQKLVEQIGLLRSRPHGTSGDKTARPAAATTLALGGKAQLPPAIMDVAEPSRDTLRDLVVPMDPVFELKPAVSFDAPISTAEPVLELKPVAEPLAPATKGELETPAASTPATTPELVPVALAASPVEAIVTPPEPVVAPAEPVAAIPASIAEVAAKAPAAVEQPAPAPVVEVAPAAIEPPPLPTAVAAPTIPTEPVLPVSQPAEPAIPITPEPMEQEAPEFMEAGSEKIHLSLAAILRQCPPEIVVGELPVVPDNVRITLPFAPIDRQLVMGQVEVSAVRFVAALPVSYQRFFSARIGVKVPIPLEEVFQNLPSSITEPPSTGPAPQILAPAPAGPVPPLPFENIPVTPASGPESVSVAAEKSPSPVEPEVAVKSEAPVIPVETAAPSSASVESEIPAKAPAQPEVLAKAPVEPETPPAPVPPPLDLPAFQKFAPPPLILPDDFKPAPTATESAFAPAAEPVAQQPAPVSPVPVVVESGVGESASTEVVPPLPLLVAEEKSAPPVESGIAPAAPIVADAPAVPPVIPSLPMVESPVDATPAASLAADQPATSESVVNPPVIDQPAAERRDQGEAPSVAQPPPISLSPPAETNSPSVFAEANQTIPPPQLFRPFIVLPPPIFAFKPSEEAAEVVKSQADDNQRYVSDNTVREEKRSEPVPEVEVPFRVLPAEPPAQVVESIKGEELPAEPVVVDLEPVDRPGIISIDFSQALIPPDESVAEQDVPVVEVADVVPVAPVELVAADAGIGDLPVDQEVVSPSPEVVAASELSVVPPAVEGLASVVPVAEKPAEVLREGITFVVEGHFVEPLPAPVVPPPPVSEPVVEPVVAAESVASPQEEAKEEESEEIPLLPLPRVSQEFTAVDVLPPPALPLRRFDQDALQALFMTEDVLDLAKISRLAAQLPGIHACVIATRDQACTGGDLPEGFDLAALLGLAPRVGEAAGRMPIGDLKHFTLYGEQYSVSFFARNGLSLCAVHRPRSFVPGVREKLVAIADELSK